MMLNWARATCGMMGRSPDFMNVTYAAWAGAADYFGRRAARSSATTCGATIDYIRENDLTLTHSLINLQRSRNVSRHVQPAGRHGAPGDAARPMPASSCAAHAFWRRSGPLSDEIAVYSPRLAQHRDDHSPFALSFAIPCGTPGAADSCAATASTLGSRISTIRLGSRFEEMDCVVFFDDVLVPWERVFLLGDVDRLNSTPHGDAFLGAFSAHQGAAKNLAKCEFVLGARAADDRDARQRASAACRGADRRADDCTPS